MAAKASAAMSWRPPLGLRAVVEAIAEHGALEEGEAGPGPQPALFLHEGPSPGFGTNGTPALPLARKRMPLNDGCGATCPCSAHETVSCPCGVCHAFCGESLLSLRRRLRPLSIPGINIHGNIFLAFRLLIWQPSLLFLFLLFLLLSFPFFFCGRLSSTLEPSLGSSNAFVLRLLSIHVTNMHSLTTKDC